MDEAAQVRTAGRPLLFTSMFTLPARIAAIAYQNKAVVYNLLFKASSQTKCARLQTIPSTPSRRQDRLHLGAPHLGLRDDPSSTRPHDRAGWWDIARRHPLGRLPPKLSSVAGKGPVPTVPPLDASDAARRTRDRPLAVLRRPRPTRLAKPRSRPISRRCIRTKWFVYSKKRPFAGPEQVLAYLSRYTHRVAISSSRLIAANATGVTFSYKDYPDRGTRPLQEHDA